MPRFMPLPIARMASAMWVGAALLFVLTSVAEQTTDLFPLPIKNRLALVRFPWYYAVGAISMGLALVGALAVRQPSRGVRCAAVFLALALATMALDYTLVYRPLRAEIAAAPSERSAVFTRLHRRSEIINACGFFLSAAAAACLCASDSSTSKKETEPKP